MCCMLLQVMPAGLCPSVSPREGVYLTSLTLYNALWDTSRGTLMTNTTDATPCQEMPILWLVPSDIGVAMATKHKLYPCPVYCTPDSGYHGDPNLVTCLPLPTLDDPSVWYQSRVFLSSSVWLQSPGYVVATKPAQRPKDLAK